VQFILIKTGSSELITQYKDVVKKKKKNVKESYIYMMSYPHAQDFPTSKMQSMTRQEKKNPFILKDLLVVSRLKYLLAMEQPYPLLMKSLLRSFL